MTYKELLKLREQLINGEIDIAQAKLQCWKDYKEGQRSWHTIDWKERREELIKDKCEVCYSKDTLTLQHLSHPRKYTEHRSIVIAAYTKNFIESGQEIDKLGFKLYILNKYDYEPVPLCPNCKARKPNKRIRKSPQFLCKDCKHEFDLPISKSIDELLNLFYEMKESIEIKDKCFISKDKWKNIHSLMTIQYWFNREMVEEKYSEAIEKEAFLNYLDENIKYLSFSDTITACKKCATNYDIFNLEICPSCKVNYKGIQFSTCIQCLPEVKRAIAVQKVEFGKKWSEIEKELGID